MRIFRVPGFFNSLLIDIIGGLIIGIVQHGMKWDDALHTYTLLTIGDGIVTQVPALVIAVGTGIIVTRSGSDSELSTEIVSQIFSFPKTLILVALALFGLLVLPGMPAIPILALLLLVGSLVSYSFRHKSASLLKGAAETKAAEAETEDAYDLLTVEPVEVAVGQNLIGMVNTDESLFLERISVFRKQYVADAGFVLPKIRFRDEKKLPTNNYEIRMFGVALARGEIVPDRFMAIHSTGERTKLRGIETTDPTYGLPAYWITEDERSEARSAGYTLVDPVTVFMTHLSETIRQHASSLLTRAETDRLIDRVRKSQSGLVEELVPGVLTLSEIQKVLQNLLREKVSIRNLESIMEVLVDSGRHTKDADALTETVRQKLGPVICQSLSGDGGYLHVLTLDPQIEQTLASSIRSVDERSTLVLEPRFAEQMLTKLAAQVEKMMKNNLMPVLLCSPELRRHIRRVTERVMPHLSVVSMAEVPNSVNLKSFAVVTV
jgi:flagellar biosynthesis protein FlhA